MRRVTLLPLLFIALITMAVYLFCISARISAENCSRNLYPEIEYIVVIYASDGQDEFRGGDALERRRSIHRRFPDHEVLAYPDTHIPILVTREELEIVKEVLPIRGIW